MSLLSVQTKPVTNHLRSRIVQWSMREEDGLLGVEKEFRQVFHTFCRTLIEGKNICPCKEKIPKKSPAWTRCIALSHLQTGFHLLELMHDGNGSLTKSTKNFRHGHELHEILKNIKFLGKFFYTAKKLNYNFLLRNYTGEVINKSRKKLLRFFLRFS